MECSNVKKCKMNLGFIDDLTQCMIEMDIDDLNQKRGKEKALEEKPLDENDWICDKCQTKNRWIAGDLNTSLCVKCQTKNEIVEYQAKFAADDKYRKDERQYFDHFKS